VGVSCVLEIEFQLNPQKRREFAQSLEFFVTGNPGCKEMQLLSDRAEPNHLFCISKWADLRDLQNYTKARQFRALMGGLRLLSTILDCRIVTLDQPGI
jgi:quinol monooxygenase YgiN